MISLNTFYEVGEGITGSEVTKMVQTSSTENLSIWALVVILLVFIAALVIIIKVFLNTSVKTNEGLKVIIQQNAEQFNVFRESLDKMSENFRVLSESMAKFQVLKGAEDDKYDILMNRFQELKNEISGSHNNLNSMFRSHEKNEHQLHSEVKQNIEKFRTIILEMRSFFCGISSWKQKKLGEMLVDEGICTRDQIEKLLRKQVEEDSEDKVGYWASIEY